MGKCRLLATNRQTFQGSGLPCNAVDCGRVLKSLDRPTDGHSTDAEMLGDGLHAIGARAIRLDHGAIAVTITGGASPEGPCHTAALAFRNFSQRALGVDQALQACVILEAAVGRLPRCVPRCVRQGTMRRNSCAIATSCNTAGRRAGRASGVVAALTQPVNPSRAKIRANFSGLNRWRSGQLPFLG